MQHSRVSIEDVAQASGVSRATVSRVLNGDARVRPATVRAVREAAQRLGYVAHSAASALSGGRSRTVAVLLPDILRPYYATLLQGANRVAQEKGYHLIFKAKDNSRSILDLIEAGLGDGFIIRHARDPEDDRPILNRLRRRQIPFIYVGRPAGDEAAAAIQVDNVGGARQMAHHFVEHGFRRVLFIGGPEEAIDSRDRAYGFRVGLSERGFDLAGLTELQGDYSRECGYRIAGRHLAGSRAEAVFAANDRMALGVLLYCHEHGIRVPEDLAIAGFDDAFFAEFLWPPLTTVRQPMHEIGVVAMENIVMAIEGTRLSSSQLILPTRLVPRRSCGCEFHHFGRPEQPAAPQTQEA